jgi:hypothetical protein
MNAFNYVPENALDLLGHINREDGQTESVTLNALVAILSSSGVTLDSLHSEHCRPLIVKIYWMLHEEKMKEYIDNNLNNPLSISIDPIIREIFLGKFLIDSPSVEKSVKIAITKIVSLENNKQ